MKKGPTDRSKDSVDVSKINQYKVEMVFPTHLFD